MKSQQIGNILIVTAGIWYFILRGAKAAKVEFESLQIKRIGIGTTTLSLSLQIHNPLLASITIKDIVGDIYMMDIKCAKVNFPINQTIKAFATSSIVIDFEVGQIEMGDVLWANIQTGDINNLIGRFVGYIDLGKIKIPLDRTFAVVDLIK